MKKWVVYLLIFPFCNLVLAQEKKNWVLRNLGKLGAFIDTMTVRGIDPSYIEVPQKPWQLILRYNTNDMHMTSRTKIDQEQLAARGLEGELNWETTIKPMATTSVGAWIGYRGYGLGYSYSFNKQQGQNFAFSATGSNYSVSIHLRRFKTSEMGVHVWGYDEDGTVDETFDGESFDPLTIHTTMVNGFYMLNSKRFSCRGLRPIGHTTSLRRLVGVGSRMVLPIARLCIQSQCHAHPICRQHRADTGL